MPVKPKKRERNPPAARVGCAGWSIPRVVADAFPGEGTHLMRYARRLGCVEINSSFYRPHRPETYARWAASVPDGFRFSVKLPRQVTHLARLAEPEAQIDAFIAQVSALENRLGPVLVQLPPSLAYEPETADDFFAALRARLDTPVVCEPRHASWFEPEVDGLWSRHAVGRVAADPARLPAAAHVGGSGGVAYFRLHGSPRIYYDAYGDAGLAPWAGAMREAGAQGREVWAILDNTTLGHAAGDALALQELVGAGAPPSAP